MSFTFLDLPTFAQSNNGTSSSESSSTTTPLPEDVQQRIDDINAQKAVIDALIQLRTSEQNLLQAEFPQGQSKPLEGKLEGLEQLTGEPQILAYKASQKIAEVIGNEISKNLPSNAQILIYDKETLELIQKYNKFIFKANSFKQAYEDLIEQAKILDGGPELSVLSIPQISTIATSVLSNLGDVLAFFRVDRKFFNAEISEISEQTFVSQLVDEISESKSKIKIYYPKIFTPIIDSANFANNSIIEEISELEALKVQANQQLELLNNAINSGFFNNKQDIDKAEKIKDGLESLNEGLDRFINAVNESKLSEEILALPIIQDLSKDSFVLSLNVLLTKGNVRESNSFFAGKKFRFSAKVAVEYLVFDSTGLLVVGGTESHDTGFKKLSNSEEAND